MTATLKPSGEQPVTLLTPQALWQQALDQLRLLVPEGTFNALFVDTSGGMGDDGSLLVNVSTAEAKAWIEARLFATVKDALGAANYTGPVSFRLPPPAGSVIAPLSLSGQASSAGQLPSSGQLPTPGPVHLSPGDVALTFLNFNLYARGWLRTPSYYELFWQATLGYLPYAYWRLMQALYWSNPSANFTRRVRLDIQDSAAHLGVSRDLVRGKPAKGLGGSLKILSDQQLAEVERHATGRATVYTGRFRRRLPLLAPAQVDRLTQSQQEQHLDWLLAAGYDPATWESLGERYSTFVLPDDAPPAAEAPPPVAGTTPAELQHYVNPDWESEQLSRLGFLRTPVYYDLFLQPLIGSVAYAIWRACKCLNWSDARQTYTQDTVTSVYSLAATLNCNRQKITGVRRRRNGVAYWQEGAFDKLRNERLALIREEGDGSQVAYRLLVVNEPPLLCPSQADKFPVKLKQAHANWLNKARLELEEWQQLSLDSLLVLVE
jgi:hypothetical protein